MTLSLANDFRPKNLDEVLGQAEHVEAVKTMVEERKFPGAFLLGGPSGTGKTTMARVLAKILTCANRDGYRSCGECIHCVGVDRLDGPNFFFLDGGAKDMTETIRQLTDEFFIAKPSMGGRYKVVVLDEFQRVSGAAKSVLLAPLEEMASRYPWVVAIFTTTEPDSIEDTLTNRCYPMRFEGIDPGEMVDAVKKHKPELAQYDEGLKVLADRAQGCMRQVWRYIEQAELMKKPLTADHAAWLVGGVSQSAREALWKYIEEGRIDLALDLWDNWVKRGVSPKYAGEMFLKDAVKQASLKPDSRPWLENLDWLARTQMYGKESAWRAAIALLQPAPYRKPDPVILDTPGTSTVSEEQRASRGPEGRKIQVETELSPEDTQALRKVPVEKIVEDMPVLNKAITLPKVVEEALTKVRPEEGLEAPGRVAKEPEPQLLSQETLDALGGFEDVLGAMADDELASQAANLAASVNPEPVFDPWAMDFVPKDTTQSVNLNDLKAVYEVAYG